MVTPLAVRYLEHEIVVYRRIWRSSIASSFLAPMLFLAAIGGTLGSTIDKRGAGHLGGVSYLVWLAPGLLASNAMQVAVNESTWPVLAGFKWVRHYFAAAATPLRPGDIVVGYQLWVAVRLATVSAVYIIVATAAGAVTSVWIVAAIPMATLTGLAFSAPVSAWSATRDRDRSFSAIQRFGILPLFLFSGTFFPVGQLPAATRPVAYLSPLWHGVSVCRSLALGRISLPSTLGHTAFLTALVAVGIVLARRAFERRLQI
jgi:lipooligosaccharide transport system permease protein